MLRTGSTRSLLGRYLAGTWQKISTAPEPRSCVRSQNLSGTPKLPNCSKFLQAALNSSQIHQPCQLSLSFHVSICSHVTDSKWSILSCRLGQSVTTLKTLTQITAKPAPTAAAQSTLNRNRQLGCMDASKRGRLQCRPNLPSQSVEREDGKKQAAQ